MIPRPWEIFAACGLILCPALFFAGVWTGYTHRSQQPPAPLVEAARPAVIHPSGAVTLERIPATPARPAPPPLEKLPGSSTTHEIILTVAPSTETHTAQLDIQEGKDGTRVTLEGQGITGQDFTLPRPPPPKIPRWTAGAAWDGKNYGPMLQYQWNRVTVGAYATRNNAAIFAGLRF